MWHSDRPCPRTGTNTYVVYTRVDALVIAGRTMAYSQPFLVRVKPNGETSTPAALDPRAAATSRAAHAVLSHRAPPRPMTAHGTRLVRALPPAALGRPEIDRGVALERPEVWSHTQVAHIHGVARSKLRPTPRNMAPVVPRDARLRVLQA